jgi:hypothetical protein
MLWQRRGGRRSRTGKERQLTMVGKFKGQGRMGDAGTACLRFTRPYTTLMFVVGLGFANCTPEVTQSNSSLLGDASLDAAVDAGGSSSMIATGGQGLTVVGSRSTTEPVATEADGEVHLTSSASRAEPTTADPLLDFQDDTSTSGETTNAEPMSSSAATTSITGWSTTTTGSSTNEPQDEPSAGPSGSTKEPLETVSAEAPDSSVEPDPVEPDPPDAEVHAPGGSGERDATLTEELATALTVESQPSTSLSDTGLPTHDVITPSDDTGSAVESWQASDADVEFKPDASLGSNTLLEYTSDETPAPDVSTTTLEQEALDASAPDASRRDQDGGDASLIDELDAASELQDTGAAVTVEPQSTQSPADTGTGSNQQTSAPATEDATSLEVPDAAFETLSADPSTRPSHGESDASTSSVGDTLVVSDTLSSVDMPTTSAGDAGADAAESSEHEHGGTLDASLGDASWIDAAVMDGGAPGMVDGGAPDTTDGELSGHDETTSDNMTHEHSTSDVTGLDTTMVESSETSSNVTDPTTGMDSTEHEHEVDHCVEGYAPHPTDALMGDGYDVYIETRDGSDYPDAIIQTEAIAWMEEHYWQEAHYQWHQARRCPRRAGVDPGAVDVCNYPEFVVPDNECENEANGLEFLAMHRHMLQTMRQLWPNHQEQFTGWDTFPDADDYPELVREYFVEWSSGVRSAAAIADNIEQNLSRFPTEGAFGQWIQCGRFGRLRTSNLHGALHFNGYSPDNQAHSVANGRRNLDAYLFWKLHGWIDKVWERYRVAKGLVPDAPELVSEVENQCHEMHRLAGLVESVTEPDPDPDPDPDPEPDPESAVESGYFHEFVRPILENSRCRGCHGTSSPPAGLQLGFLTSTEIVERLVNRPAADAVNQVLVVPGQPLSSWFYLKVSGLSETSSAQCQPSAPDCHQSMPLGNGPLSPADAQVIYQWILEGALPPTVQ